MAHRNARLTPVTRLELVREVEAGWSQAEVGRRFRVSRPTVAKWVQRFREAGTDGLEDRTSAPHSNPRRTSPELESRICAVRRGQGFGPHRIAWALGLARSTVYAVLRRSASIASTACIASPARRSATSTQPPATCCTST